MLTVRYQPIGHVGFLCEVSADSGASLNIERSTSGGSVAASGTPELVANGSVVRCLSGFAEQEFQYRRCRAGEKRDSHRKQADEFRELAIELAEMVDNLGVETCSGWCSACLQRTLHRRVDGVPRPAAYLCESCGACMASCAPPRCDHFAIRSTKRRAVPTYCAEHRHEIPGFEKLGRRLEALEDYAQWLKFDKENLSRRTKLAVRSVGGAALLAPFALAAAPAVGGVIGSWAGLSGAAATSHGLAMLGGGSLAAGGLGMAGGTTAVTLTGSALGATVTSAYAGADRSFRIELVEPGTGAPVVFAKGFLTDGAGDYYRWIGTIRARYPTAPIYRVHWGAKELKALGFLLGEASRLAWHDHDGPGCCCQSVDRGASARSDDGNDARRHHGSNQRG
jgi:hypothetical protein